MWEVLLCSGIVHRLEEEEEKNSARKQLSDLKQKNL